MTKTTGTLASFWDELNNLKWDYQTAVRIEHWEYKYEASKHKKILAKKGKSAEMYDLYNQFKNGERPERPSVPVNQSLKFSNDTIDAVVKLEVKKQIKAIIMRLQKELEAA